MKRISSLFIAGAAALLVAAAPIHQAKADPVTVAMTAGIVAGSGLIVGCAIVYEVTKQPYLCNGGVAPKVAEAEPLGHYAYAGRNVPRDTTAPVYPRSAFGDWLASVNGVKTSEVAAVQ